MNPVRQPIRAKPRARQLEERLALRFPKARVALGRAILGLPPRSRLRRAFLRRMVELGLSALDRMDYDAAFAFFHPDAETRGAEGVIGLGAFPEVVHGRAERAKLETDWRADWGDFRYAPNEIVDLNDRLLLLGRMVGTGAASGVPFDIEWADMLTLSGGQVVREHVFFNRAEALRAAGLAD
jgi:ketosteroid isomerase-like protein